jgi:hypothetical protein
MAAFRNAYSQAKAKGWKVPPPVDGSHRSGTAKWLQRNWYRINSNERIMRREKNENLTRYYVGDASRGISGNGWAAST